MNRQKKRQLWLVGAEQAWKKAPAHVRVMAGDYVGPLLEALKAIGDELDEVQGRPVCACNGACKGNSYGA